MPLFMDKDHFYWEVRHLNYVNALMTIKISMQRSYIDDPSRELSYLYPTPDWLTNFKEFSFKESGHNSSFGIEGASS